MVTSSPTIGSGGFIEDKPMLSDPKRLQPLHESVAAAGHPAIVTYKRTKATTISRRRTHMIESPLSFATRVPVAQHATRSPAATGAPARRCAAPLPGARPRG